MQVFSFISRGFGDRILKCKAGGVITLRFSALQKKLNTSLSGLLTVVTCLNILKLTAT